MNLTAIAIIAIISGMIVSIVKVATKHQQHKTKFKNDTALEQELAALRERVEVLESIVTDSKYDLNRQFDELKKDRVA